MPGDLVPLVALRKCPFVLHVDLYCGMEILGWKASGRFQSVTEREFKKGPSFSLIIIDQLLRSKFPQDIGPHHTDTASACISILQRQGFRYQSELGHRTHIIYAPSSPDSHFAYLGIHRASPCCNIGNKE